MFPNRRLCKQDEAHCKKQVMVGLFAKTFAEEAIIDIIA